MKYSQWTVCVLLTIKIRFWFRSVKNNFYLMFPSPPPERCCFFPLREMLCKSSLQDKPIRVPRFVYITESFCCIQGLVAAHGPPVAVPAWLCACISACWFGILTMVGMEGFCNLSSSCVLSERRRWQGCSKIWSRLNVTGQGARKKGDTFETRGRRFSSSKGPDRRVAVLHSSPHMDYSVIHSSDYWTISIWRLPWALILYLEV